MNAATSEDYKRGFLAGAGIRHASVDIMLQALDALMGEGMDYAEARDVLDQLREAGRSLGGRDA